MSPGAVALCVALCLAPGAALAHASERAVILTLPTGHYLWGAGLAVALTALAAAAGARLPAFASTILLTWRPRRTAWPSGLSALALLALVLIGLFGNRDPMSNALPLMIWTVLWVGLVLATAFLGDLWRPIEPWTGPVRATRALLGRTGGIGLARLGHWPAVVGLFAFSWYEIVSLAPDDPARLARAVAVYWLVIFLLAVAEGEGWLDRGEFLTVFFALVARIAPLWIGDRDGRRALRFGWPGAQLLAAPPLTASAAAFVTLALSTVSFDGLHQTFRWLAVIGVNPLDFQGRSSVMIPNSLGLLATWAAMAALILGAVAAAARLAGAGFGQLAGPWLLSFVPIAAGYHIAHYLVALLTQGQYAIAALDDPLHRGDHFLGLPDHWVSFGFLSQQGPVRAIWQTQFAVILGAHLLAVLVAEQAARRGGLALRPLAHLPVSALMVVYTVFGLWLLSTPAIG
jgi:hypothetical protein